MHKKIVESLKELFEHWDKDHNWLDVFVQPKKTNGFWRMCVIVDKGKEHILKHLESIAIPVGRIYGEGLAVNIIGNTIIIS